MRNGVTLLGNRLLLGMERYIGILEGDDNGDDDVAFIAVW